MHKMVVSTTTSTGLLLHDHPPNICTYTQLQMYTCACGHVYK